MQLYILANILPNLSRPYKFVFDILFVYMRTRARWWWLWLQIWFLWFLFVDKVISVITHVDHISVEYHTKC